MPSWVYETVEHPSVCPSVRLTRRSTAATVAGGFAAERLTIAEAGAQQRPRPPCPVAQQQMLCGQRHVDSRCRRQNRLVEYAIQ